MAEKKWTAPEIIHLLAAKYSNQKGYAFFSEIAPGLGRHRRTDGFAIGLYSSHGHPTIGFEVKVARSDWIAEMKDPSKSDEMFQYCSHWYLVAAPGVCQQEELPDTWGLMEPGSRGLKIAVKAPKNERKQMPVEFLSVILRRDCDRSGIHDWVPRIKVDEEVREAVERELKWKTSGAERELQYARRELERMRDLYNSKVEEIRKFHDLTGITIADYTNNQIAKVVKLIGGDLDLSHVCSVLDTSRKRAEDAANTLSAAAAGFRAIIQEEHSHA